MGAENFSLLLFFLIKLLDYTIYCKEAYRYNELSRQEFSVTKFLMNHLQS